MPRWTTDELNAYYARREAFEADGETSRAKPQQAVRDESVAEKAGKTGNTTGGAGRAQARTRITVRSFRVRLLDVDNGTPKYFIDSLRYAGLIPDDTEGEIALEYSQTRIARKQDERTEILIEKL